MSDSALRASTIFPLPSSPHWAPTTTVQDTRGLLSVAKARGTLSNAARHQQRDVVGRSRLAFEAPHGAGDGADQIAARPRGAAADFGQEAVVAPQLLGR